MAFSFVHAADLHLDCPLEGLGEVPPELAAILKNSTFRALDSIVDLCIEQKTAFLVVAGDVYNAKDKSLCAQLRLQHSLARLAEASIPSYIVHGNHDPANGWNAALDWPDAAHFLSSGKGGALPVICHGTEIASVSGISYAKGAVTENLAARLSPPKGSPFSVAVLHCNCGQVGGYEAYSPCTLDELARSGFDYWALGHVHKRSILHEQAPVVLYPGNPQGLNPKETGPKGCYLVHVSDSQAVALQFVETDAVRWSYAEVACSGMTQEQELIDKAQETLDGIRNQAGRPALVRLLLTGRTALHRNLARPNLLREITEELRDIDHAPDEIVWLEAIQNQTRLDIDLEERRTSKDFLGDFLRAVQEARANSEKLAELKDVLEPLFSDRRGHKYLPELNEEKLLAWLDEAENYGLDALVGGAEE